MNGWRRLAGGCPRARAKEKAPPVAGNPERGTVPSIGAHAFAVISLKSLLYAANIKFR
jgi:hypothetical protein